MQTIWKFPVHIRNSFDLDMPVGAEVLTVQTQLIGDVAQIAYPQIWAIVDPDLPNEVRSFRLRGTGQPFDGTEGKYIGTFQALNGQLIWHLFEAKA